jgi:hypothetical protein
MLPNQAKSGRGEPAAQAQVLRHFDGWLQPEFDLSLRVERVDVHSPLLAREKEEPKSLCPEDRRTHNHMLHQVDRDDYLGLVAEQ